MAGTGIPEVSLILPSARWSPFLDLTPTFFIALTLGFLESGRPIGS
jgi:hypothetical protein